MTSTTTLDSTDRSPEREVHDAWTGRVLGRVPIAREHAVQAAVAAARTSAGSWAVTEVSERGLALEQAAVRIRAEAADLAKLATAETGRPLARSSGGVAFGAQVLDQYASLAVVHQGQVLNGRADCWDLQLLEPRGVVAVLPPWNEPVAVICAMAGAALATGNTVVVKPSERASLVGARVGGLLAECVPPGVCNVVSGDAHTGALLAEAGVDLIAHVGSTSAGQQVALAAARTGAASIRENGGKDAVVVDAGVDPRWAAAQVAAGAFDEAGQVCVSVERVYVHEDLADAFEEALGVELSDWQPQDPMGDACRVGPLVDADHARHVVGLVDDAVRRGARVLRGPQADHADLPRSVMRPTVLLEPPDDACILHEETFGPVVTLHRVASLDEGVRRAAESTFGLSATILTPAVGRAAALARRLPVGTVRINDVHGGAPGGSAQPRRGSGAGFGFGPRLLEEMTVTKVVHLAGDAPAAWAPTNR